MHWDRYGCFSLLTSFSVAQETHEIQMKHSDGTLHGKKYNKACENAVL